MKKVFKTMHELAKALMMSAVSIAVCDDLIDDGLEDLFFESCTTNGIMIAAIAIITIGCWCKTVLAIKAKDGE